MANSSSKQTISIVKVVVTFIVAMVVAIFAWFHGGWYGLFAVFFLVPFYALAGICLLVASKIIMRKYGPNAVSRRVRIPYIAIVTLLIAQLLAMPALSDSSPGGGYWSILTGYQISAEGSTPSMLAGLYFLATNLIIVISFIAWLVLLIKDTSRARKARS